MAGKRGGLNEDALSEIIGFVLILALVVAASTLYLLYVVPAEGREDEIEHMNQVQERFISYKTSVDGLWLRADSSTETRGVSLSTSFDLGTGGGNTQSSGVFLAFMRPIGTAARMSIEGNQGDTITIKAGNKSVNLSNGAPLLNIPPGYVNYTTDNYYWIQQGYSYEMGGVFLEQVGEGVSVKVSPALSLYKYNYKDTENVKFNLCLIKVMGSSKTVGGTGPLRIETRLREDFESMDRSPEDPIDNVTITVKARDRYWARAWQQVFTDAVDRSGLRDNRTWYKITPETPSEIMYDPSTHSWPIELSLPNETSDQPLGAGHVLPAIKWASMQVTFEYADSE